LIRGEPLVDKIKTITPVAMMIASTHICGDHVSGRSNYPAASTSSHRKKMIRKDFHGRDRGILLKGLMDAC